MPIPSKTIYEFGPFRLDGEDGMLTCRGQALHLPPKAADVLIILLDQAGTVISREELSRAVWADITVVPATLNYQIHVIRRGLREAQGAEAQEYIETIPSRGFRFLGAVVRVAKTPTVQIPHSMAPAAVGTLTRAPARQRRPVVLLSLATIVLLVAINLAWRLVLPVPSPRVTEVTVLTHDREGKQYEPIVVDGTRVLYSNFGMPTRAVPIRGGASTRAFTGDYRPLDVNSRRSAYLALRMTQSSPDAPGHELWILSMDSGLPVRVGDVFCTWAGWSRDGQHIAFVRGSGLYLVASDGSGVRSMPTPRDSAPLAPRFSPDGQRIRFSVYTQVDRVLVYHLWEVTTDGTDLHRVVSDTVGLTSDCCGVWSPNGEQFVFQGSRDAHNNLWLLDERSRGFAWLSPRAIPLTGGPIDFTWPTFGANDTTLFAIGEQTQAELVRLDRTQRQFVPYLHNVSAVWITYSPDTEWMAYVGYPDRTLWRARRDGSQPRQLTSAPFDVDGAAWSPSGQWIAFRARTGRHFRIYLISPDGGEPHALTGDDEEQGIPTWSADGRQIAFGDVPSRFGQAEGKEVLHVYDLARQTLTTVPGSRGLWTCRWSHDGRQLAALTIAGQTLMVCDLASGRWRSLNADHVDNPTWSRDDRYLYYDTEGAVRELRRVRVADGQVEFVADLMHFPLAFDSWSGLTPDDSPMVLRSLTGHQVYALRLEQR
jgi:Tol biopolymer transport system component/DNA-binding winged helix-turn-helix (wHTH) protein